METLTFAIITSDKTVVINGQAAFDVDMVGIASDISAVQWSGASGWVEYFTDPTTGLKPNNEPIDSYEEFQPQLDEAAAIIEYGQEEEYAKENPKTYYLTVDPVGFPVTVTTVGWPQPPDTTTEVPPAQESSVTRLYWNGTDFVWSAFPIDLDLEEAKSYMTDKTDQTAYSILLPSDWMVSRQTETGVPVAPAWTDWRQTIRDEAQEKRFAIEGTATLDDLNIYCQSTEYLTWSNPPA
jgi:hypothetical protein